ncbi:Os01g0112500, partial [Oryza sativa Japonica Group]
GICSVELLLHDQVIGTFCNGSRHSGNNEFAGDAGPGLDRTE